MQLNAAALQHRLSRLTDKTKFCVALSGGIDSLVLLHILSQCVPPYVIRAIHINHQLSQQANVWQAHCEIICEMWKIPFNAYSVTIKKLAGESLEALAREARYDTLSEHVAADECLLTAHHADDQAETILLQLMRGAGVAGLAAMPGKKSFAKSFLLRPLLEFSRADIEAYAKSQHLSWIEDDSNENLAFDRNYLRHQIMPLLKTRWPKAPFSIARSGEHCAAAKHLLFEIAAKDLISVLGDHHSIDLSKLLDLPFIRQQHVIRYWIHHQGFSLPSTQQLEEIFNTVIHSRFDAIPCVEWESQQVRRYRHHLYLLKKLPPVLPMHPTQWDFTHDLILPNMLGILQVRKVRGRGLKLPLQRGPYFIRFRQGGEVFVPSGCQEHHRLKKLFQEWGVPPWLRERVPLLYCKEELIMVIGYRTAEGFSVGPDGEGIEITLTQNSNVRDSKF
ncbi:MAG: tRNA lysidine(34) synthetase TilS [Coxiella sp. RIFCSPHIGHO2_12_FULL_42_15]|nr:MAG: tRNA lysidine(34) synthetase TilS [Coxiella sp. RIFCSPHIGHO2_12_FULL_42_15]